MGQDDSQNDGLPLSPWKKPNAVSTPPRFHAKRASFDDKAASQVFTNAKPSTTRPRTSQNVPSLKREPSAEANNPQPPKKPLISGDGPQPSIPEVDDDATFIRQIADQLGGYDSTQAKRLKRLLMFNSNKSRLPLEVHRILRSHADRLDKLVASAKECRTGVEMLGDSTTAERLRVAQVEEDLERRQKVLKQRLSSMKFG